jgi:hypothetical protein
LLGRRKRRRPRWLWRDGSPKVLAGASSKDQLVRAPGLAGYGGLKSTRQKQKWDGFLKGRFYRIYKSVANYLPSG